MCSICKSNNCSLKYFYKNIWSLQDKRCVINLCVDQIMYLEMLLLGHYGGVGIIERTNFPTNEEFWNEIWHLTRLGAFDKKTKKLYKQL